MPKTIKTEMEAWQSIMNGVSFFLARHTFKTLVVLAVLCGGVVYAGLDYLQTKAEAVAIEKAVPLGEGFKASWVDKAYALGSEDPLVINGKTYGYIDPNFQIWKLTGKPRIIIYDKRDGSVVAMEIPSLEESRLKRYK